MRRKAPQDDVKEDEAQDDAKEDEAQDDAMGAEKLYMIVR